MAIPLVPGQNYTLSFYAKGSFANYLTLNIWGRGQTEYLYGYVYGIAVNNQWQRFTITFTATEKFDSIFFDAELSGASGERKAASGSMIYNLKQEVWRRLSHKPRWPPSWSAPHGVIFLPFGQAPDFNLMIQSLPDAAGTVSLSVEDFFFKTIF